ncbi:cytoplasmic dynein 1 light intermediate chain 2-like [Oppia nitens]|uniref:cytoplasmic dynein 1 light intermediate chain 2-like n=1 Tax=Oppia nitens TaxID=1686743 RepID=UPI0023DBD9B2|nr:cytoplasmic dynein 1 light intermediate chain 2-like [Oppia nitens]
MAITNVNIKQDIRQSFGDTVGDEELMKVDNSVGIWSSILRQVQTGSTARLPANKSVVVLGEKDAGKSSLIAKLQGSSESRKGTGLEYHPLLIRDEDRDDQTQCGVWILDGNFEKSSPLLRFAINEQTLPDTTVVLVTSWTKPWEMIANLEKWSEVLRNHIQTLDLKPEVLNTYKNQIIKRYQEYKAPVDDVMSSVSLDENIISVDTVCDTLGMDVLVVITKSDYMSTLEKEYYYKEEMFDFIQQSVRQFCLKIGAGLVFVSVKTGRNCDLLYRYLCHRIYGLDFQTPAQVVDKDALFVPIGWDNDRKISILYENMHSVSPDNDYNDVIARPIVPPVPYYEFTANADNDQEFLRQIQTMLGQETTRFSSTEANGSNHMTPVQPKTTADFRRTPIRSPSNKSGNESNNNTPDGQGVLKSFFEGLLIRKSGGTPSPRSARSPDSMAEHRLSAQEELERMTVQNRSTPK